MKGIVTISDIARQKDQHPNYVGLHTRRPDFPEPVDIIGVTKLYRQSDVDAYYAKLKREGKTRERRKRV